MKKILTALCLCSLCGVQAQTYETRFARPLHDVLEDIGERFQVRLKYDIDTVGKVLPYADFRIRPYSLEESLTNVLAPFDYSWVKQHATLYKLKNYEYPRRKDADGRKMLDYLMSLYSDRSTWEMRRLQVRKEVRERLGVDSVLAKCVQGAKPILSKVRKFDGYTVQNFALETLPGLYVCGSIYAPRAKGKHPLIVCPNGHFGGGRYRKDQQQRLGTLARMGAICVDYDLWGWGESALQVGSVSHRSSIAHVMQAAEGLLILDYMLKQNNVDASRVGVNGGSGGGTLSVLLSTIDDRFTAAAPVVSLASHFDGGCPCESGMPVQLAAGGTCNAEMAATFVPKPMLVVSDGGDWTASVPKMEYPYLQYVYGFYDAQKQVTNVHLPKEKHDFGPNKRNPVYDFFGDVFQLDKSKIDETKVTVEPEEAMYSFGVKGELLPEGAVRSFQEVMVYFDKQTAVAVKADAELERKANEWTASLNLEDKQIAGLVSTHIYNHLRKVRDWHNAHPYTMVPEGINPLTGKPLTQLERQMIADSAMPKEVHTRLMKELRRLLTEEQVEAILDKYTVGKVAFTLKGYQAIVPNLTEEDTKYILTQLKLAREQAIDYKSMKQISAIFEIYKTNIEQYFTNSGRSWRKMFKEYVDKRKAEKERMKQK